MQDIHQEYQRYKSIVEQSRYITSIEILVKNPESAFRDLYFTVKSNCYGTVAYVARLHGLIKEMRTLDDGWHKNRDAVGDFIVIPDADLPGYIGEAPMREILTHLPLTEDTKDSLLTFHWDDPNTELNGFRLRHAAIHLSEGVIFHQRGEGKRYQITTLDEFTQELSQHSRDTLAMGYFRGR